MQSIKCLWRVRKEQRSAGNSTQKDPVKESLVCSENYHKANVASVNGGREKVDEMELETGCGQVTW